MKHFRTAAAIVLAIAAMAGCGIYGYSLAARYRAQFEHTISEAADDIKRTIDQYLKAYTGQDFHIM